MKPLYAIAAIVATVSSATVFADTSRDAALGLLGAIVGAATATPVAEPTPPQNQPSPRGTVEQSFDRRDLIARFQRELQRYPGTPKFAAEQACGGSRATAECMAALRPELDAIAEENRREIAARRKEVLAEDAREARAAEDAHRPISAAFAASGDWTALQASCDKLPSSSPCVEAAAGARMEALKERRVQPTTCREFGFYNGHYANGANPMAISLEPAKAPGLFNGKVTQIDGRNVVIYNAATRQNAVVNVSASKIFPASAIAVGSEVLGYGVQTGTRKGKTVAGAITNIAEISANCIGAS